MRMLCVCKCGVTRVCVCVCLPPEEGSHCGVPGIKRVWPCQPLIPPQEVGMGVERDEEDWTNGQTDWGRTFLHWRGVTAESRKQQTFLRPRPTFTLIWELDGDIIRWGSSPATNTRHNKRPRWTTYFVYKFQQRNNNKASGKLAEKGVFRLTAKHILELARMRLKSTQRREWTPEDANLCLYFHACQRWINPLYGCRVTRRMMRK